MTDKEKAKRYDEAIKRAKEMIKDMTNIGGVAKVDDIQYLFPELKESEGERIRKKLLALIEWSKSYTASGITTDEAKEMTAWLESQGEQKPNPYSGTSFEYNGHTWGMCARDNGVEILIDGHLDRVFTINSNAKEMFIKALERVEEQNNKGYKLTDCDKNSWWEDFKAYTSCIIEQKPIAWSEEDKYLLDETIKHLEALIRITKKQGSAYSDEIQYYQRDIDWLKSLRPQSTWKPSEEEMKALAEALSLANNCGEEYAFDLRTLYKQLKKLREE